MHAIVHRLLRDAVAWGRVGRNVAELANGLCWRDLDLDARRVTVCRQLRLVRGRLDHVDIAKPSAGHACGAGYRDHDLVCAEPDGSPLNPGTESKTFDRRVKQSGLPRIRFHDLRHTHAATRIAANTHAKVVSARLRHTSTSFTLARYGHLGPNLGSDAATAAAALVDGPG